MTPVDFPTSVDNLPTLAAVLEARGEPVADLYACPGCTRQEAADGIVSAAELPTAAHAFLCRVCASGPYRDALAALEVAALAALQAWDTELAGSIKRERDRLVNATLWATADGSPLTDDCQAQFVAYRTALHRITLEFSDPSTVVWPSEPSLVFQSDPD